MWCTCPAGYTGAFCQKKGKSRYNENVILHGILAVIAWVLAFTLTTISVTEQIMVRWGWPALNGQGFPHRRTGRGGEGGCSPPPHFGQLRFFGQLEKIWAKPGFKDVSLFFLNVILRR